MNSYDSKNLINSIKKNTDFFSKNLKFFIVFVHKYRNHSLGNSRLMKSEDRKYIFEFFNYKFFRYI